MDTGAVREGGKRGGGFFSARAALDTPGNLC